MKRYWLFAGDSYYAAGGMTDFVKSFDSPEKAKQRAEKELNSEYPPDWWQIFDSKIGKMVYFKDGEYTGYTIEDKVYK